MIARILAARLNRSFVLLPTLISLLGLLCAVAVIGWGPRFEAHARLAFPAPDIETVRTLLSTIAGSALTVLSLVYSLTLVVFTLAAGNISPRLITRFTEDRLIQVTAGMLAATYLYCIVILQRVDSGLPWALSSGLALLWAIVSISLLIVFIHKVATRITIDEEIARIGATLAKHIDEVLEEAAEDNPGDNAVEIGRIRPKGEARELIASRSGYVEGVDIEALVAAARKHDLFVEVLATPGQFVVQGCALARYVGSAGDDSRKTLRRHFLIGRNRTPDADLDFSILLLVEIAQRALSPGINDAFTAIAVIDHLSSAYARILRRRAPSPLYRDREGEPRLWCEIAAIDRLLGTAFHPLRRDSAGNVTVILRLVAALDRLSAVARPDYRPFLERHIDLIEADIRSAAINEDDRKSVIEGCEAARRVLHADSHGREP